MYSSLFGQYLLERNVIDADQLTDALEYQSRHNRLLGKLAVEKGILDEGDVSRVVERQWQEDMEFGQLAMEMGLLSEHQRDDLLREQKSMHIALGEALIRQGALDQSTLEIELAKYDEQRDELSGPGSGAAGDFREMPSLCFFHVLGKVLPRVSAGKFIPGGFYPTIQEKPFDIAISQRLRGDLDFEAVLLMPEELLESLGHAVLNGGGGGNSKTGRGRVQLERAMKAVLGITARQFIRQQALLGVSLTALSEPRKISENTFHSRRSSAVERCCVEILLINPPVPRGEFLQFNLCLLMKE